jgi:hypothetical protein
MQGLDLAELRTALSTQHATNGYPFYQLDHRSAAAQSAAGAETIEQTLSSALTKAGIGPEVLRQDRDRKQREARRRFEASLAVNPEQLAKARSAYEHSLENRRRAFEILNGLNAPPFQPQYITLDTPVFIIETPHFETNVLRDSKVQAGSSYVKILVDVNDGSDSTQFHFYYLWQNESSYYAVANVTSSLLLTGGCGVTAATGVLSGDRVYLSMQGILSPLEWWDQQHLYPYPQQSQYQQIVSFDVTGGGFWDDPATKYQLFSMTPYDLRYDYFIVPPGASAVFDVSLLVSYGFPSGGGDIADIVSVNFSDNRLGYSVTCPYVQLELLTPPPAVAGG